MADEFNFLWSEIQNYNAEADADLIPVPGQAELHGRCRYGVLLSPCSWGCDRLSGLFFKRNLYHVIVGQQVQRFWPVLSSTWSWCVRGRRLTRRWNSSLEQRRSPGRGAHAKCYHTSGQKALLDALRCKHFNFVNIAFLDIGPWKSPRLLGIWGLQTVSELRKDFSKDHVLLELGSYILAIS